MFFHLLKFEIKDRLYRWSTLVYFLIYLLLSFLISITFAGAFKGAVVSFGLSNKLALNSPIILNYLICFLNYMGLLVVAPLFGQSINKDYENKFNQILFSTPIQKRYYFFSRYFASFFVSLVIMSSIGLGIFIASFMPFIDQSLVLKNNLYFYIYPYLTNVIPNLLIFGAIFISVIAIFKKMAPVYIASIFVFTGWMISQSLLVDIENKMMSALVEPFGLSASGLVTKYWSIVEQTHQVVPVTSYLLYNRILWLLIGILFLSLSYIRFNPFQESFLKPKVKELKNEDLKNKFDKNLAESISRSSKSSVVLGSVSVNLSAKSLFFELLKTEIKLVFKNIYFLMILLCGILYVLSISSEIGKAYGTEILPVMGQLMEVVGGFFGLFVLLAITLVSGELIWRARDSHFYEIVDSKPISNLNLYLSKFLALFLMQVFLNLVVLLLCILIQIFKGYFNFEIEIFLQRAFIYGLPGKIFISILALFIHTVARSKVVGHAAMILYYVLLGWLPSLGFDHLLYQIGQTQFASYSDMNKFGTSFYKLSVLSSYWGFFHLALAILTLLIWRRGSEQNFKLMLIELKRKLTFQVKTILGLLFLGWLFTGSFIFYNTNILNKYITSKDQELIQVNYEKKYKELWSKASQPDLVSVKLKLDLYPETQSLISEGEFNYINKTSQVIDKIFMGYDPLLNFEELTWSQNLTEIEKNTDTAVIIYQIEKPLKPNEKLNLKFKSEFRTKGFTNDEFQKNIVENGSFFYANLVGPTIGYFDSYEVNSDKTRRKYGLPEKKRVADINDLSALNKTYISSEGNWIDFEVIIGTSPDQIAISPGYLVREWNENNRRYFHYKMDKPILNFYSFLSARYAVKKDRWNDVNLEIYYHPTHTRNLDRMMNSTKKSLDYFTKNFSPYQFKQFRIIEFPNYRTFAQSFPNTIPFSEGVGFIDAAKENDPESIDYTFFVTSHELAHQWWAHQIISGPIQGATMLVESLAEYSALMVQEKQYGPKQMRKFLKYELDKYLGGRSREPKKELPLALNENQTYIHYQKGSLVFYALKDYLGEDVVNGVLKEFIKDYGLKPPPFPRSIDLVERFRKVAPDDKKYLIEDLFETITFYDNRTLEVKASEVDSKFKVKIKAVVKKTRAGDLGDETEIAMNDYLDVGIFDEKGEPIYFKKHLFKSGESELELVVDQKPFKAGIDPYNKLIDKVSDDNQVKALF